MCQSRYGPGLVWSGTRPSSVRSWPLVSTDDGVYGLRSLGMLRHGEACPHLLSLLATRQAHFYSLPPQWASGVSITYCTYTPTVSTTVLCSMIVSATAGCWTGAARVTKVVSTGRLPVRGPPFCWTSPAGARGDLVMRFFVDEPAPSSSCFQLSPLNHTVPSICPRGQPVVRMRQRGARLRSLGAFQRCHRCISRCTSRCSPPSSPTVSPRCRLLTGQ